MPRTYRRNLYEVRFDHADLSKEWVEIEAEGRQELIAKFLKRFHKKMGVAQLDERRRVKYQVVMRSKGSQHEEVYFVYPDLGYNINNKPLEGEELDKTLAAWDLQNQIRETCSTLHLNQKVDWEPWDLYYRATHPYLNDPSKKLPRGLREFKVRELREPEDAWQREVIGGPRFAAVGVFRDIVWRDQEIRLAPDFYLFIVKGKTKPEPKYYRIDAFVSFQYEAKQDLDQRGWLRLENGGLET